MPVDLYYTVCSGPCLAVRALANTLGVELNLKETDLSKGDNRTAEFVEMNPQHCVPTLNDNGFVLWESRAILGYLVDQYGKDDTLYPRDPKKRAVVNQRLYFDIGTLYPKYIGYYRPILYEGKAFDPATVAAFKEPIELLDKLLDGKEWVAGDHITIADYSILTTISLMEGAGYDLSKHTNVSRWFSKTSKSISNYNDIVLPEVAAMLQMMKKLSASNAG